MNATTLARAPKRNHYGDFILPEQVAHAHEVVGRLVARGWDDRKLASALGYKNDNSVYRFRNNPDKGMTTDRYAKLCSLDEQTTVTPISSKRPAAPPAPRRSVLNCIDNITAALHMARDETRIAMERCVPLLRPGLTEVARDIDQVLAKMEV
jgi:hypothetical protein